MTTSSPVKSTTRVTPTASIQPDLTTHRPANEAAVNCGSTASAVGSFEAISRERLTVRLTFHGRQIVTIYVAYRADGVTVLTFNLPTKHGEQTAQVWMYADGDGIRVRSHDNPNNWHTITAQRCTCFGHLKHHHCYHADEMVHEAMDVAAKWRYVRQRGPWGD